MEYYMSKIFVDYIELGLTSDELIKLFRYDVNVIRYERDNYYPYINLYSEMEAHEFQRYVYTKIIEYINRRK